MSTDKLLLLGVRDEKLTGMLSKLGYGLVKAEKEILDVTSRNVLDLLLVDARFEPDALDLCHVLRGQESTKDLPIVYITERKDDEYQSHDRGLQKIEFIYPPFGIGSIVSKIATNLRLRKIAGGNEQTATLAEMNAMLRDLNARFERELSEARQIQEGLLPEALPKDDRFDLAVVYEPLEEVGGDWYYLKKEKLGRISMQIADVTGHGLSAAFVGSMTKLALAAANKEMPNELLTEMNRLMAPQIPQGKFVTMYSCLYDPTTGELFFSRAGHPPALMLNRKEGKVTELKGEGFAVGFFEDSEYSLETTRLEADDLVVTFTDGIVEAQNRDGKIYGTERFSNVLLASSPKATASEVAAAVLEDFDQFRQGRILKDDVTLIVLKRIS